MRLRRRVRCWLSGHRPAKADYLREQMSGLIAYSRIRCRCGKVLSLSRV